MNGCAAAYTKAGELVELRKFRKVDGAQTMKKLLTAVMVLAALVTPAMAAVDGHKLVKYCSRAAGDFCYGYVVGVADAKQLCGMNEAARSGPITGPQMRDAVLRYLYRNPQRLNMSGEELVIEAFNAAWPCKAQIAEKQKQQRAEQQFQEWKQQQEQPRLEPSSDDDILALGAALTVHYERCGGYVTLEQKSAVAKTLNELGSEVAAVSREIEHSSCSEIKSLYQIMKEATRRTLQ